jgi:hypothetical protein
MPADDVAADLMAWEAEITRIREEIAAQRAALAAPTAGIYWPPAEFAALLRRWPWMAEDYGDDHDDYVHDLELRLRELSASGVAALAVAPGTVEDFLHFATYVDRPPETDGLRADYAAALAEHGQYVPWPPAPDAACWCGTGAAYARCCGALPG